MMPSLTPRKSTLLPALLGLFLFAGCNTNDAVDAPVVERGPKLVPIEGDPNGLWWDYETETLYIADDDNNRILKWTDAGGIALHRQLAAPHTKGLGQVIKLANGTLVVTRFGGGNAGDVIYLAPGGTDSGVVIPGLSAQRRRIGLTVADDGTMFVGWFTRANSTAPRVGAVGTLSLAGGEPEVITGLKKPVGVLAMGSYLYVADQDLGQILRAPLSKPDSFTVFATLNAVDMLGRGPGKSLFASNAAGSVFLIDSAGAAASFATGFQEAHGVAYDSVNKRVFIADHDNDADDGVSHALHIRPVD